MSIIYGSPLFLSSSSQNADLPPLLDNFKAFEGGGTDDGLTRLKDLPNGTKVKFGTYNSQTLVWRIAQDEGVTKAVLDLDYDTGKTVIGDMVVSPANSICGNWAITGWLNATESGGSWWANRVHYEDSEYPETEPTYSSQDGFLHGWSESDRGLLQNIEWGCDDFILGGSPEPYQLNCKLMICSEDEAYAAWNGERFCVGFGADTPVILRDYSTGAGGYSGISGMGSSTMEGAVYKDELSSAIGIWLVCAPNPEAVVPDEPDDDGCYTIDYNKIAVTIQANKMELSRANELAGAVWVYADHEPENVNDGTKIQLTREEITRPDGEMYLTLNDIPASDAEIETIINIKESDGELHPYLYLSNDYLGSGAGLLLRKDCYQKGVWHVTGAIEVFNGSQFDVWCSNTFPTLLDTSISNILMEVNLPTKTTGAIRRKCFTLSNTEYGGSMYPAEGTALPYFKDNVRRQSMFNGGTVDYWTRSKYDVSQAYFIGLTGGFGQDMQTLSLGYRPAFCLPLTFKLKATPNENGSYDMYDEVSSISTFASSEFIVEKSVSWEQTKDFHVRQFTYNSKKQYQTMLEGATANIIYSEFPEEPTEYTMIEDRADSGEFIAPEDGWYQLDAVSKSGDGGNSNDWHRESSGQIREARSYVGGSGGSGGISRKTKIKMNKGEKILFTINSGSVEIEEFGIRVTPGGKGGDYDTGSGGTPGSATGGDININGKNGAHGYLNNSSCAASANAGVSTDNDFGLNVKSGRSGQPACGGVVTYGTPGNDAFIRFYRGNTNTPSPSQASTLSLIPKNNSVEATWENSGDPVQIGTMLVYNTSHIPKSPSDGVAVDMPLTQPVTLALTSDNEELQKDSKKQSYTIKGVPNDKPVFVALFPYDKNRKYGLAKQEVEIPREHSWYDKQQELEAEVKTVKAEMADYQSYYTTTQEVLK